MPKRLIVIGEGWDTGIDAWIGAKLVRLEESGSWTEIGAPGATGAWYLREYFDSINVPRLFYIAANGTHARPFRGTLYRSQNEGDTWVDVTPPLGYCIGISLGAGDRLWAITDDRENPATLIGGPSRIYYSDNWGQTWTLSYTIPEVSIGTRGWPLYNITAHPTDYRKIVVEGVEMIAWGVRMWSTVDGGDSWSVSTPTFPFGVTNTGGQMSLSLTYAYDGSLIYLSRGTAGSNTFYIFRSTDDGANFSTWYSDSRPFGSNDGIHFLAGCGALYFLSDQRSYVSSAWGSSPTTLADNATAPFIVSDYFRGIDCPDAENLVLGVHSNPVPPESAIWVRPLDLSTGWIAHPSWADMNSDVGYLVYCWPGGILGASEFLDRYEVPCDTPYAAGSVDPRCIAIMEWEISVDGKNFFTEARAEGMGMNNPGQAYVAKLDDPYIWSPASAEFGKEGGSYNVRRELVVQDYGINEAGELNTLAGAYLTSPEKKWKGMTTIKFSIGGMPRASATAPTPNKILQAGDQIRFGCGSDTHCGIAEGEWVVDEVHYEFPKGITTVLASRRPAAMAVRTRGTSGNIRNLGETIANEFGVWESPWFTVEDTEFFMNPNAHDADRFYGVFKMEHYMGVIPRTYIVLAAKQKIYDWYDDEVVIAAQPLYVPRQFLDISQVQGVGYNLVAIDEIQAIFHFWRYLFYDGLDSRWVPPEDRFLKIWLIA